jgi:serine/threonine protein phosphatase 1
MQGGDITVNAFSKGVNPAHLDLLQNASLYYILDNDLFVHGGFITDTPLERQDRETLLWDRTLVKTALLHRQSGDQRQITTFNMVYVGHTPTINFNESIPIIAGGVCMMDTGAGWPGGVLTIMDINSGMYWSSDMVSELYRESRGRA